MESSSSSSNASTINEEFVYTKVLTAEQYRDSLTKLFSIPITTSWYIQEPLLETIAWSSLLLSKLFLCINRITKKMVLISTNTAFYNQGHVY